MAFVNIAKFIIGLFLIGCTTVADTPPIQFVKYTTFTLHVDEKFNEIEKTNIRNAIRTWERVSSGSVKFVVWWNQPRPGLLKYEFYKEQPLVFLWSVDRNDKELSEELRKEFQAYRGLYSPKGNILIFDSLKGNLSSIFGEDIFRSTVMHELGHMFGLDHSENRSSLMYPMIGSWCITEEDAEIFCKIYGCIPSPECKVDANGEIHLLR